MFYENAGYTESVDKANKFNDYFHKSFNDNVYEKLNINIFRNDNLCSLVLDEEEVFKVLKTLDSNKATGNDGISPKLLKECAY